MAEMALPDTTPIEISRSGRNGVEGLAVGPAGVSGAREELIADRAPTVEHLPAVACAGHQTGRVENLEVL